MLDRAHRLSSPAHFRRVIRRGRRGQHGSVLVYVEASLSTEPRFGFVVAKTVGNAVTRNLVKRRLRAVARELLATAHGDVVVRALPTAGDVSATQLTDDFEAALRVAGGVI